MQITLEKPGTPGELVHFGVKGMHWGVRKQQESSGDLPKANEEKFWTPQRKKRAKQAAIGAGILVGVAGTAYVAYRLNKSGKLPISSLKRKSPATPATKKVVADVIEQTDMLHTSRGKDVGVRFFRSGGIPSPLSEYESVFGRGGSNLQPGEKGFVKKLADGRVATHFVDPLTRRDNAGRPITHEVIIPKSMSSDIHNVDDVLEKIWPELQKTYYYTMKDKPV